jgi:hypothetical protein
MFYAGVHGNGWAKRELPKVTHRMRVAKGSNVIKKAVLSYAGAVSSVPPGLGVPGGTSGVNPSIAQWVGKDKIATLEVQFINPFPSNSLDGTDFDFTLFPVVDGNAWDDEIYGFNIIGTLKNEVTEIDDTYDYVDMYTGHIADVQENIREIAYDLGPARNDHEVIVVGRAIKGQRYWAVANTTPVNDAEVDKMDANDIDIVYHLDQRGGLDKVADHVELRTPFATDYVFDKDLKFLGMGDAELPYQDTYYVADHMIEVAAEEEPLEEDEETDPLVVAPETGGDDVSAPAGIFENPSTGA